MKTLLMGLVAFGGAVACPVVAAPIIYEFSGVGSGTLGGAIFTDATIVFTIASDTDAITPIRPSIDVTPYTTLNVSVAGRSGTFDQLGNIFVNRGRLAGRVGIGIQGDNDLFDILDPAFVRYDLRTPAAAATQEPSVINIDQLYATSLGDFSFTESDATRFAFRATLVNAAVPETGSWAMMVVGFGMIGAAARTTGRRQRQRTAA